MQFVVFWSNFDKILLNNNIQKRIIFIQHKDNAATRLLGYSYDELRQMQILQKTCSSCNELHSV